MKEDKICEACSTRKEMRTSCKIVVG